jgi:hypothetical protein
MRIFRNSLVVYLSFWMIMAGMLGGLAPIDANAALMPSDLTTGAVVQQADPRRADLDRIQSQLESKLVSQRLNDLGLTPEEVQLRMQSLTDEQLHQVAQNLDGVQMGGDLLFILLVIGAVVLVLALVGALTHH